MPTTTVSLSHLYQYSDVANRVLTRCDGALNCFRMNSQWRAGLTRSAHNPSPQQTTWL